MKRKRKAKKDGENRKKKERRREWQRVNLMSSSESGKLAKAMRSCRLSGTGTAVCACACVCDSGRICSYFSTSSKGMWRATACVARSISDSGATHSHIFSSIAGLILLSVATGILGSRWSSFNISSKFESLRKQDKQKLSKNLKILKK